jgi:hypothetical protein
LVSKRHHVGVLVGKTRGVDFGLADEQVLHGGAQEGDLKNVGDLHHKLIDVVNGCILVALSHDHDNCAYEMEADINPPEPILRVKDGLIKLGVGKTVFWLDSDGDSHS